MWGCANAPFAGFGGGFGILVCLLLLALLLLLAANVGRLAHPQEATRWAAETPWES